MAQIIFDLDQHVTSWQEADEVYSHGVQIHGFVDGTLHIYKGLGYSDKGYLEQQKMKIYPLKYLIRAIKYARRLAKKDPAKFCLITFHNVYKQGHWE